MTPIPLPTNLLPQQNNTAAGADRIGFQVTADTCPTDHKNALFVNNTAHACLVGLVLTSHGGVCSSVHNFTAYHSWDYGMITVGGLDS